MDYFHWLHPGSRIPCRIAGILLLVSTACFLELLWFSFQEVLFAIHEVASLPLTATFWTLAVTAGVVLLIGYQQEAPFPWKARRTIEAGRGKRFWVCSEATRRQASGLLR